MYCWRPIVLVLALFLAGCGLTPQGDFARSAIASKGAEIMDQGLANAEWFVCKGASVGSVKRRYGQSQEMAEIYKAFCRRADDQVDVIELGEPG